LTLTLDDSRNIGDHSCIYADACANHTLRESSVKSLTLTQLWSSVRALLHQTPTVLSALLPDNLDVLKIGQSKPDSMYTVYMQGSQSEPILCSKVCTDYLMFHVLYC